MRRKRRGEIAFTDPEWARLRAAADTADALSAKADNTRPWNPDFNFVGIVGEATFARYADLPFFPERRSRTLSDGGEDFPGVDVKGVVREPPLLMRLRTDPLKAAFFALVFVHLEGRFGRYVGYASREMLDAAPDREFGYGPTRTLGEDDLLAGLPPSVDLEAARREYWTDAWRVLYERRLGRDEHERERDVILGRARADDELAICMEGHGKSVSFRGPHPWADE